MNPLTLADQHIYGFEGTFAEVVFILGFTALLLLTFFTVRMGLRLWILAAILFATALTAPVDFVHYQFIETWMLPVQKARASIHLTFGILLTVMVIAPGRVGLQHVSFQSVLLLVMGIYMALLQFVHAGGEEGIQSIGFALATIPCMMVGVPLLTRSYDQCVLMLKSMMVVSTVWTCCCSIQFITNPKYLVNDNGRFWGMLGNAQHAAVLVAPFAVIALWLIMHDKQRRAKILWIALLAINLLFLLWSGSRTGALMFVLGAVLVFYSRGGKAVIFLPFAALMFWGLYYLSDLLQIGSNVERLVSGEDTRKGVWTAQIAAGLSHPLFGVGMNENIGGSESSYLAGFAAYGFVVLVIMIVLLLASAAFCLRLMRGKPWLPDQDRSLVDIFVAFNAMYFVGAAFEGYLAARSSTTLTMMLMFSGIGVYVKERIAEEQANVGTYAETAYDEALPEGGEAATYNG
jgi:hypothetical protein